MASRDPDELRAELRDITFSGDLNLLRELRDEARETVEGQRETLSDIDTKASRVLRLNLILLGVLVSVVSIAAQTEPSGDQPMAAVQPFVNVYMKAGIASLVLSTLFAGITYTASELDVGVSSENLLAVLDAPSSTKTVEELLVKNYIMRINFNRSSNIRNIPLVQATILLVLIAMVLISLGVYEAVIGPAPWSCNWRDSSEGLSQCPYLGSSSKRFARSRTSERGCEPPKCFQRLEAKEEV
jgi:hypothetical protein